MILTYTKGRVILAHLWLTLVPADHSHLACDIAPCSLSLN